MARSKRRRKAPSVKVAEPVAVAVRHAPGWKTMVAAGALFLVLLAGIG
ncbi:MAG: hypothetical protein QG656_1261, partial [Candidatus Hydrogenedentes bacterium]|nr:hypothetical protein [Candidatus Hydrogenedentota bacterium]